jgi:hypothetical protein
LRLCRKIATVPDDWRFLDGRRAVRLGDRDLLRDMDSRSLLISWLFDGKSGDEPRRAAELRTDVLQPVAERAKGLERAHGELSGGRVWALQNAVARCLAFGFRHLFASTRLADFQTFSRVTLESKGNHRVEHCRAP